MYIHRSNIIMPEKIMCIRSCGKNIESGVFTIKKQNYCLSMKYWDSITGDFYDEAGVHEKTGAILMLSEARWGRLL